LFTKQEILEKKLRRAEQKVNVLEKLIEDKSRNLYLAKEAVQKAHDELERRVEERTAELSRVNKQLKQEIEDRKRAEEALREQQHLFKTILAATPDLLVLKDRDSVYKAVNPAFCQFIGKKEEEIIGKTDFDFFPHAEAEIYRRDDSRVMETRKLQVQDEEVAGIKVKKWLRVAKTPVLDETGEVVGILCSVYDISDRKRAEAALRKSEEEKGIILEAMSELVLYVDTNMKILWANRAAADSVGLTADALVGSYCYKEWFQRSDPCSHCPADKIFETNQPQEGETYSPDGRVWFFRGYPVLDENGDIVGIVEVVEEITERKRAEKEKKELEAKLQHAQRLEAIGTLAGGIAHDFNNLLTGIQGSASLMLVDMKPAHRHYERLKTIEKQVQSGAKLTSHLLGYARKGRYEVKPIDLNDLIQETSDTFVRTRKNISINRELGHDLFAIEADPGQIEQVLLNLFVNAADAMPGGGELILKTSNVTHNDMREQLYDPMPGDYVLLTVTDTGTGMNKETLDLIFDPFFTTKERGRGTGLGLASVYGIIKGHGGYIDVESKRRKGTTFSIYLSASKKKARKVIKTSGRVIKGTGTVLLVDDEEVILKVGKDLLETIGYRVLTANARYGWR